MDKKMWKKIENPETKEAIQQVIDCIYDRIYIVDASGMLLMVNKAVEYDSDGRILVGKQMSDLIKEGYMKESLALKVLDSKKPQGLIYKEPEGHDLLGWANPHMDGKEIEFVVSTEWDLNSLYYMQGFLNGSNLSPKVKNDLAFYKVKNSMPTKIIAESSAMKEILDTANRVARSEATVLIQGESGTGKEVLMRYIHFKGARTSAPLIEINCGAIPEQLVESELFGYVKGAFTGADSKGKPGIFELANCGTVFLDEVEALPLQAQTKLLRVLQEREVTRIGGHVSLSVDVKIIAASNADLYSMVQKNQFRADLFYRLNVLPLYIPPLRERKEDIEGLVEYFCSQYNLKNDKNKIIKKSDMDIFMNYDWPGNIRELQNIIERVLVISNTDVVERRLWEKHIQHTPVFQGGANDPESGFKYYNGMRIDFKKEVEAMEKKILEQYIPYYHNSRQFADLLGMDKSTVNRKLEKYGIKVKTSD